MSVRERAEAVLSFWFGSLDEDGLAAAQSSERWWRKDPEFDASIRDQFLGDYHAVSEGTWDAYLSEPRMLLAAIVILDQFSRNMFRDRPEMYAQDALAAQWAREGIASGALLALRAHEASFMLMPLMHSEELADQDAGVAGFETLIAAFESADNPRAAESLRKNLTFTHQHRDIVARFGRFPHRNDILGRETTAEEREFLTQPGSSF